MTNGRLDHLAAAQYCNHNIATALIPLLFQRLNENHTFIFIIRLGISMSGKIVPFPGSRADANCTLSPLRPPRSGRRLSSQVRVQIERMADLLEELEAISDHSSELSPAMQARVRDSISKAALIVQSCGQAKRAPGVVEDEGDPQPHVDREVLERVFQSWEPHP